MTPTVSSLRALPDWSAVPSNSEEDRLFLNRRVAFFGRTMFFLALGFLLLGDALRATFEPEPLSLEKDPALLLDLVATTVFGLQWLACRSGRRSAAALNWVDIGGLVTGLALYCISAAALASVNPEASAVQTLVLTPVTMIFVMTRAVVIPGTARRTLLVSSAACLPLVSLAYYTAGLAPAEMLARKPSLLIVHTSFAGLWAAAIVSSATLAARVIYGLQLRVREATELGQYTLEEKIGEGGMGIVYRARHALLRRPTAVKLLAPERAGEHNAKRFEREVQLTSSLTHPNTIAIYDYGHTPDGIFYYAMEYLDGVTLEELVAHDGPQPAARVIHILRQVCGALSEAHAIGLIHRDIKPANIMLCERGGIADHVKVLDFGLVKELEPAQSLGVTRAGALLGTPLYLAPEAISDPDGIDPRTDLYAVGAVAYLLLTGAPVFEAATVVQICAAHMYQIPEPPSQRVRRPIPAFLEQLVLRCLAKAPDARPASALEIASALESQGEIDPWTAIDASRWWDRRAREIKRAAAQGKSGAQSGPRTVAIDLGHRGAVARG